MITASAVIDPAVGPDLHGFAAGAHAADGGPLVDERALRRRRRHQAEARAVGIERVPFRADRAVGGDAGFLRERARGEPRAFETGIAAGRVLALKPARGLGAVAREEQQSCGARSARMPSRRSAAAKSSEARLNPCHT